ncbi:MAG: cupin domain-containing protein [Chloroflexi bacterium]|nr:cupin domain-containing protein [Chloroflexota bacterium]
MRKTVYLIVGLLLAIPLMLPACAKTAPTPPPTPTQIVTKFNVSYGAAPAAGWKWGVAELTTGADERTTSTARHGFAWIFYVVRGSTEVGIAGEKKVVSAGDAVLVPAQQDHTHRYPPQSQVLIFRPADRPFGDFHQGNRLWESDASLALNAGQNYSTRIREYTLAPGVANLTAEGQWGYVLEGTLTLREGGTATTHQAGKVFALTSNASQVLNNEGPTPVRFIAVGLH